MIIDNVSVENIASKSLVTKMELKIEKHPACSLPSAGDRSNIILGVPRSNHKEQGKFKNNVIKIFF